LSLLYDWNSAGRLRPVQPGFLGLLEPPPRIDEELLRILEGSEVLVLDIGQESEERLLFRIG